jgi:hypothetical protein
MLSTLKDFIAAAISLIRSLLSIFERQFDVDVSVSASNTTCRYFFPIALLEYEHIVQYYRASGNVKQPTSDRG